MFGLLDRRGLLARGAGCPAPVGTAIVEHTLDSVSDPSTLSQLLAAHSKERAAAAAGYANGSCWRCTGEEERCIGWV